MIQITVDSSLTSKLNQLSQAAELCDPSGRVLGRFVPVVDLSEWEPLSPEPTEEELDASERETESYTTAEMLALLEKFSCSGSDGKSPQ
jgi:hypothetical protein